jgi:EAL domain-containing protein (putative c-di-GMP-specific phosphodiesterase class I)
VNLSPAQCRNDRLVDIVFRALLHAKLHSSRLELEITEGVLLLERETLLPVLQELHELGVKIVMDDFGTANSSIAYLRNFHFDKIKIDGSFIRSLSDASSLAIVRAVTGLGASLGIATTAEGVETKEQLDTARGEGCTEVQGFLLSRPIPATGIPKLLAVRQMAAA